MIENWNLATPPHYSPPRHGSASGLVASDSTGSISTIGTELRSPPDLPSIQGFHSRVIPTSESPSDALRELASPPPKPPRRTSELPRQSPPLRSPVASASARPSFAAASPHRSPIPYRQPSWTDNRRGSLPVEVLGAQPTGQRTPLFIPPALSFSPAPPVTPLMTSSPLTFNLATPPRLPPPMQIQHDLFTPGYSMGPTSSPLRPSNALELSIGPMASPAPSRRDAGPGFGSFIAPEPVPLHYLEDSYSSAYTDETDVSNTDPAKSNIAHKHLQNHVLPGDFARRYILGDELGAGGFGFVCSAHMTGRGNERGQEVAVKFIFKHKLLDIKDSVMDGEPMESWVLRQCNHPSIVAWLDLYDDDKFFILVQELHGDPWSADHTLHNPTPAEPHTDPGRRLSLLQLPPHRSPAALIAPISPYDYDANPYRTYSPSGSEGSSGPRPRMGRRASHDLFEAVETMRFTEEEAKWIFSQIVSGVSYLHKRGMYHRDLKDENIVIDRYLNVKIIDFGSAVVEDVLQAPNLYGSFRGTYSYASPEVIQGEWYRAAPCDIWSIGIILAILLTGEQPFPDKSLTVLGKFKLKKPVPDSAQDLMEKIFRPDPAKRWSIDKVEKHRWLRNAKRPRHLASPPSPVGAGAFGSGQTGQDARAYRTVWEGQEDVPMASGSYRFGALPPLPVPSPTSSTPPPAPVASNTGTGKRVKRDSV